jgi:hypothetical protein
MVGRVAVLAVAGLASAASAGIQNGSFETGDFSDWSVNNNNYASVVTTFAGKVATDGTKFAVLQTGQGIGLYTLVSQTFNIAAGQQITGDFFFRTADYLPYNDDGFVRLLDSSNNVIATLITRNVADTGNTIGNTTSTPWIGFSYTAASSAIGVKIEVGVRNLVDNAQESQVGVDNIQLSVIPLPTGVGIAAAGLFAVGVRRSRTARI